MQSSTPINLEPKPFLKDGEVNIGVAVVSFGENFNEFSANLLRNGLEAGIQRGGITIILHGDYFLNAVAVNVITVPINSKASAIKAIRETLTELKLLPAATIAVYTDEQIWLTIEPGIALVGDTNFALLFARPEYFAQARANFSELEKTKRQRTAASLMQLLKMLATARGDSDSK